MALFISPDILHNTSHLTLFNLQIVDKIYSTKVNDLIILNYKSAYEGQYTCEAQSTGTLITNKKVVVKKYQVKTAGKLFIIYSPPPHLLSTPPHPLLIPSLSLCELYLSFPAASSHQPTSPPQTYILKVF